MFSIHGTAMYCWKNLLWSWSSQGEWRYCKTDHSVWKSQKKSYSTLRAKRAKFTFWVDKSWLKMPKMVNFGEFLKTWSLRSNSVTRQVNFNRTKNGGKCQNSKLEMRHFGWFSNTMSHGYPTAWTNFWHHKLGLWPCTKVMKELCA